MTENYQDLVFATFKELQEKGELYPSLLKPTTAKLKRECLRVYDKRYVVQDEDILSIFFDVDKIGANFRQIISRADPDDFRPLLNHLKEKTGKTDEKNSDLLAWLIDFNPRPSITYYKSEINKRTNIDEEESDNENLKDNAPSIDSIQTTDDINQTISDNEKSPDQIRVEEVIDTVVEQAPNKEEQGRKEVLEPGSQTFSTGIIKPKTKPKSKLRIAVLLATVIAIAGAGSYAFFDNINQQCMYWTGNQYQAVGCSVKMDQASIIALDKEKLTNLKRITRLDTIGGKDLGRVWYVKIKQDSAEFYTSAGEYPLNPKKRLLPMTQYILDKYILR